MPLPPVARAKRRPGNRDAACLARLAAADNGALAAVLKAGIWTAGRDAGHNPALPRESSARRPADPDRLLARARTVSATRPRISSILVASKYRDLFNAVARYHVLGDFYGQAVHA